MGKVGGVVIEENSHFYINEEQLVPEEDFLLCFKDSVYLSMYMENCSYLSFPNPHITPSHS